MRYLLPEPPLVQPDEYRTAEGLVLDPGTEIIRTDHIALLAASPEAPELRTRALGDVDNVDTTTLTVRYTTPRSKA